MGNVGAMRMRTYTGRPYYAPDVEEDSPECVCNSFLQIMGGGKDSMPCPVHDEQQDVEE